MSHIELPSIWFYYEKRKWLQMHFQQSSHLGTRTIAEIKTGLFFCFFCDLIAEVCSLPKYYMTLAYHFTNRETGKGTSGCFWITKTLFIITLHKNWVVFLRYCRIYSRKKTHRICLPLGIKLRYLNLKKSQNFCSERSDMCTSIVESLMTF